MATPAKASSLNLEMIEDAGDEEDLIRQADLECCFKGRSGKIPSFPVSLITATGLIEAPSLKSTLKSWTHHFNSRSTALQGDGEEP